MTETTIDRALHGIANAKAVIASAPSTVDRLKELLDNLCAGQPHDTELIYETLKALIDEMIYGRVHD